MSKIFYQPTRMCISCRGRFSQSELLRLSCLDGEIGQFSGYGRSFYLCRVCQQDQKILSKALMRYCRTNQREQLMNKLKEIITDDR